MSTSNKGAGVDYRLQSVTNALFLNDNDDVTMRTHVEGLTLQTGDILIDKIKIWDGTNNLLLDQPTNDGESGQWTLPSETYNMIFNGTTWDRMRGTISDGVLTKITNSYLPISKDSNPNSTSNRIYVDIGTNGTVKLSDGTNNLSLYQNSSDNVETTRYSLPTQDYNMVYNGATWDRLHGDTTSGAWVNVKNTRLPISKNSNENTSDNPIYVSGDMSATITGGIITTVPYGATSVTAFGEPYGITITPVIQIDSIYGITDEVIQTYTSGTGSSAEANPSNALFSVQSGTTSYGYGVLRSRRFLRYRPGQGALARFTAAFTPNVSLNMQRAGLFNQENAIMIGWNDDGVNGPRFGVVRSSGARTHITVLTINTAPTGSQTATITLNGVSFNIPITAGSTQDTAVSINHIDGFTGWLTDQVDNTIVFMSTSVGPKTGVFSFTSSGTGTLATGSFSTKQAGVSQTDYWTYQSSFNIDRLDGSKGGPSDIGMNPSGMLLASQYLNVYQINFRWLGIGEIRFAIEDQLTGAVVFFHRIHYTNQHNIPHVTQPSFKVGYVSANIGGTTNATVTGVCMMGAIEGDIRQNELNRSAESVKSNLVKDVLHHLLTIRNPYVTNGRAGALNGNYILNAKEIILKDISIALQGQDPGVVYIFYNSTSFSGTHSFFSQPKDNGMISTVDGTFNPAIDTAVCRFVTAINGESQYKLSDFRIAIPPGDSISIAIKSTNGITRCSVALVFSED